MKKFFTYLVAFFSALCLYAQGSSEDVHYMVITHADETKEEIDLSKIMHISFVNDNTELQITQPNARFRYIAINPADRFSFRTEQKQVQEETFGTDFSVTPAEGEAYGPVAVGSVLCLLPATASASTTFAFSEITAATPADFRNSAHYAVQFTVSALKMGGTISCAEESSAYTLTLFDYTTGTYVEAAEGTSGTIVTRKREDGQYAFRLDVTLQDGTVIKAEYDGAVVSTDDFEPMVPLPVLPNQYTYAEKDGTITTQNKVVAMQLRESTDGYLYFYFMKEGESVPDENSALPHTPMVKVAPAFVNAGEVKLAETGMVWAVKYSDISLEYADNEWKPAADNGVLKVAYDSTTQKYDIFLTIAHSYTSMGYSGGNGRSITISYKGEASPYKGTKK